jgi:glutathione synthase/RimK-type ligase-like ATP-grasp enzyme
MKPQPKKKVSLSLKVAKLVRNFRPQIRSRHPSHEPLRELLGLFPFRSVVRLGSDWTGDGHDRVELNTVAAINNSADKLRMKECFSKAKVVTAEWNGVSEKVLSEFPIVAKHRFGSRGEGNTLIHTQAELNAWMKGKNLKSYIFEKFHDYNREYRLHVTKDGCFYACRKLLRQDTPKDQRWFRNDSNCTWVREDTDGENFDKPSNWDTIIAESVKALHAVGLDFGACDVKVQSAETAKGNTRKEPKFFIIEINSAPSFGEVTLEKYLEILPKLLRAKHNQTTRKTPVNESSARKV